jgi:hypothetical protein
MRKIVEQDDFTIASRGRELGAAVAAELHRESVSGRTGRSEGAQLLQDAGSVLVGVQAWFRPVVRMGGQLPPDLTDVAPATVQMCSRGVGRRGVERWTCHDTPFRARWRSLGWLESPRRRPRAARSGFR